MKVNKMLIDLTEEEIELIKVTLTDFRDADECKFVFYDVDLNRKIDDLFDKLGGKQNVD